MKRRPKQPLPDEPPAPSDPDAALSVPLLPDPRMWEPGSCHWLVTRHRIGPVIRALERERMARAARLSPTDAARICGHSARVGAAQDMLRYGETLPSIMQAGRWKTAEMVGRYTRSRAPPERRCQSRRPAREVLTGAMAGAVSGRPVRSPRVVTGSPVAFCA
jgi:hypothetical protein